MTGTTIRRREANAMPANERVAIVTGAYRGLGLETSRQLATRGYRVVLTGRDEAKVVSAAQKLVKNGASVHPLVLDVTSDADVARLRRFVADELGRADVLVNNAAIYPNEAPGVLEEAIETVRSTLETNTLGALRVAQALVPLMIERGYGRVVNVSSQSGQLATMSDTTPAYAMSKAAMNALTRLLADAVKGRDILVNSVCPGWVRSEMGGPNAPRSVEEGAETIVWLATLPAGGPTGGFFRDRRAIAW